MPVFEYRCESCGEQLELFLRTARETPECPKCSSKKLEKLMSVPAGHVSSGRDLPIAGPGCPPADAPICSPTCCRLPQ
jgi:putative FmdB family regulatory protein